MKKIIIIVSSILGILAILAGVYFAWQKAKTILTPPSTPSAAEQPPTISEQRPAPTETAQKLKILGDRPIFDYWIFYPAAASTATSTITRESKIFYISQEGKIFELKDDATSEVITSEPIENLQAIKSSFDGRRVIIKSGDFTSPRFIIFNSETGVFESLPENIAAAAFSPDAKKIVYLERNSGNLMTKDLTVSKPKTTKIMTISLKDFDLEWLLPEKIILLPKPSAFYPGLTWTIDIKNKTLVPLGAEGYGLMVKWSVSGKLGLQFSSQAGGRQSRLNLINEQGAVRAGLDFITLPDKCFISETKIYCAVPAAIPAKTILPDDYLKRAVYFKDGFYQIDIAQNSLAEIPTESELVIDAFRLTVIDNKLIFINRYDNRLYGLEL